MATCENCSTSFTPSDAHTEVTSLRILCANCEAQRKAERARRAAEKAPRPAAASAVPPVPTTRRANPTPPSSPVPVATTPATNSSPSPRAARPAPPPTPPAPASEPAPRAPTTSRPSSTPKSKPRSATPDVRREVEMLKARENKVMMYGWIVCGVLAVIALGVWWRVQAKRSAEEAAVAAHQKEVNDFATKMRGFDLTNLVLATEAIALAESQKPLWEDSAITSDIGSIVAKAKTNIESARDRKELELRMTAAEEGIQNAASKTPKEIAQIRRTLQELENKADSMGPEFKARVAASKSGIDRTYVIRLHDDAKATAAKGPSEGRAALAAYTLAEDEVLKLFEAALRSKNKEAEEYYRQHFKDIITESDLIATALFTPEVIEKVPWKDLLSSEFAKSWANDGLKGFRIENGALQAVGPEIGAGKIGIMSIGDREQWRDFEIDAEFTLVAGTGHFFFRLGKRTDNAGESYSIAPGEGGFKLGEKYGAKATFIGSKISITWSSADVAPYEVDTIWSRIRKGAFGMTLTEGSEIKLTRLRIRELR